VATFFLRIPFLDQKSLLSLFSSFFPRDDLWLQRFHPEMEGKKEIFRYKDGKKT
jgi:hypothetical protein